MCACSADESLLGRLSHLGETLAEDDGVLNTAEYLSAVKNEDDPGTRPTTCEQSRGHSANVDQLQQVCEAQRRLLDSIRGELAGKLSRLDAQLAEIDELQSPITGETAIESGTNGPGQGVEMRSIGHAVPGASS